MSNNITYQQLAKYIKKNKNNLSKKTLIFLLNYAAAIKEQNTENVEQCNKKEIIQDLIELNKISKSGALTTITCERLERELKLFEAILNNKNLEEISYELDKLYIEAGLGVRNNSVLTKTLLTNHYIKEKHEK